MAIEPPARFAVLGAGPIGLEAALYARYLGFEVAIYDQGEVCEHVRRWSHVELVTPFRENSTSLGRQAVRAQDENFALPAPDAIQAAQEWLDRYLLPLANVDLLSDSFRTGQRVVDVSRLTYVKTDIEGMQLDGEEEERRDEPLRVLAVDRDGNESVDYFDAVIDASGVLSQPLGIGPGGARAIGEPGLAHRIGRTLLRKEERSALSDEASLLIVGSELSAARQIAALADVAERRPGFRCVWIVRGGPASLRSDEPGMPYRIPDLLGSPQVRAILTQANAVAKSAPWLTFVSDAAVEEIRPRDDDGFEVRFVGRHPFPENFAERQNFDRVLAFVGYRPDLSIARECQLRLDVATEGPALLAAALLEERAANYEGMMRFCESEALLHPEADLYVVGAKSFGRLPGFLLPYGFGQIREIFGYVGERPDLDLYARAAKDEGPEWKVASAD